MSAYLYECLSCLSAYLYVCLYVYLTVCLEHAQGLCLPRLTLEISVIAVPFASESHPERL